MGNCQAIDAAALVVQHPNGRLERMYWAVTASEVMKMNPGHYVSLVIPLPNYDCENSDNKTIRFTRVKLLRPSDTLVLGHAYRLVTTQEVMKVLRAKRDTKMKKNVSESDENLQPGLEKRCLSMREQSRKSATEENSSQPTSHERDRQRPNVVARSKSWRPSLQSISESLN
ncbi:hypothetical protein LIER_20434 [Lithospermum erythrorhizon]|uniref:DUF4228 domain-containing protein n=1 Tax=Lithospermum erythrorhizon TaxID=34254 RepID=A0AAV3QMD6_LITER